MAATDGFARGHFAARVIAVLLFVAPLLLWWSARDPGGVESVSEVTGIVVEQNDKIALVDVGDGRRARIFVGRRQLAPGTEIRLRAERYADGSERFWVVGSR
jgi:hypothetical protein